MVGEHSFTGITGAAAAELCGVAPQNKAQGRARGIKRWQLEAHDEIEAEDGRSGLGDHAERQGVEVVIYFTRAGDPHFFAFRMIGNVLECFAQGVQPVGLTKNHSVQCDP